MTTEPTATIILSGAYCGQELRAEFGRLPPSFLPVGDRRLYERQVEGLRTLGPLWITAPDDFEIGRTDQDRLREAGVAVVPLAPSLSLAQSLGRALAEIGVEGPVRILHGDTLVSGLDFEAHDAVAVQTSVDHYDWGYCAPGEKGLRFVSAPGDGASREVACGYFHFADASRLRASLEEAVDFIDALNLYGAARPLRPLRCAEWHDFGHLTTFYRSKRNLLTARAFNSVRSDGLEVVKSSTDTAKIRAEAAWYRALPTALALNVPRFLGDHDENHLAGYRLEYLYLPTLADLFVFGRLPASVWTRILAGCGALLGRLADHAPVAASPEGSPAFATAFHDEMMFAKSRLRLERFLTGRGWSLDTAFALDGARKRRIGDVLEAALDALTPATADHIRLIHGDFFFGNLFYDFRANRVMMVDPRGHAGGGQTCIFGDVRYDVAKLAHSAIGCYDHIIAGRSRLVREGGTCWRLEIDRGPHADTLAEAMIAMAAERVGLGRRELLMRATLLFLSMLPLHADSAERQDHLLANAMRLAASAEAAP